ncbi:hypothetical protein SmJEL517_g02834 [Synchytrium microbalum]|uniref:Exocyst complex component 8 n=1 Tax=Synchytrium microbalum TaxID=1806994 RepID=A0A507C4E9_9FUNG|nr:uncharacterized protein SmJEL517_g02834 [Synchytrium microbalum]TPX34542.1 hypothetical protein SmJEL517_g02834 [Synchytrium microbalum]
MAEDYGRGSVSKRHSPLKGRDQLAEQVKKVTNLEIQRFADESFSPNEFVSSSLTGGTEDSIRTLHAILAEGKGSAAADLQRNVHRNYNEFVIISKEISQLEADLLILRGLLNELKDLNESLKDRENDNSVRPQDVGAEYGASMAKISDSTNQLGGSVDELSEMRKALLTEVYENVEGLEKALPSINGRRLLRDGTRSNFYEVQPSTFKQKTPVQFFLFNDALVVATKKKNLITGKTRLVVDRCWGLAEISVMDVSESDSPKTFQIVKRPDVNMYRAESADDKRSWMAGIKRGTDDMIDARRKTQSASNIAVPAYNEPLTPTIQAQTPRQIREELGPADLKWLLEVPDELDVSIAHRDFEEAVKLIEHAQTLLNTTSVDTIRVLSARNAVDERTVRLQAIISRDLANPLLTKTQVRNDISWLQRLGLSEEARDGFLSARSAAIRHKIRLLRFDGQISGYITELAETMFRQIRNTCDWYGTSFSEPAMASGFMKWVKSEIEVFVEIFRLQVFDSNQPFTVISECVQTSMEQVRQLREVGLDLGFLLERLFHNGVLRAIESHFQVCQQRVTKFMKADKFEIVACESPAVISMEMDTHDLTANVSISLFEFWLLLTEFASDVSGVISMQLYSKVIWCLGGIFTTYVVGLKVLSDASKLNIYQKITLLTNAVVVVETLLPKVASQLGQRFERPTPELDDMQTKLRDELRVIRERVIRSITLRLVESEYDYAQPELFSSNGGILEDALPSESMVKMIYEMNRVSNAFQSPLSRHDLLVSLLDLVFSTMSEKRFWETDKGPRRFGFAGVQHLVLDIHFLLQITSSFASELATQRANEVCEHALRAYFGQKDRINSPLKTGDWYDRRADAAVDLHHVKLGALTGEA